jgi:hypothetical protein
LPAGRRPAKASSRSRTAKFTTTVAVLLAFAANGAEGSTILLGPFAVFALAPIAMIAFWWENWPGTRLRPSWSGWADTLLIAAIAVVMTMIGQRLVGHFDLQGIFSLNPAPTHSPAFPITLPLAGAAFVAIMQLTFVCERWPFHRLGSTAGGLAALACSWAIALLLFFTLVKFQPPPGPFSRLGNVPGRLLAGNVAVIAAAILTFLAADTAGVAAVEMIALAGAFIAAALVTGLLFDGWLPGSPRPSWTRPATVALDLALAAVLYAAVNAYADHLDWTNAHPIEWVAHVMLNAIALSVILHVAIGRRWPFDARGIR